MLVNNAGYSQSGAVETVSMDAVRRQFETNVFGLARMCQLVLPGMRAQGAGKIVNLSSMGGRFTFPGGGYYHAPSTRSRRSPTRCASRWRAFGIGVIVIEPGLIRTQFGAAAVGSMTAPPAAAQPTAPTRTRSSTPRSGRTPCRPTRSARSRASPGRPRPSRARSRRRSRAGRPRTRYTVTGSAKVLLGLRALLPDRGWDAFVGSQFPRPGKARKGSP